MPDRGFEIAGGILYIAGRQYALPESEENAGHIIHRHLGNIDSREYERIKALLTDGYQERVLAGSNLVTPWEAAEIVEAARDRTARELELMAGRSHMGRLARYIKPAGRRYGKARSD